MEPPAELSWEGNVVQEPAPENLKDQFAANEQIASAASNADVLAAVQARAQDLLKRTQQERDKAAGN